MPCKNGSLFRSSCPAVLFCCPQKVMHAHLASFRFGVHHHSTTRPLPIGGRGSGLLACVCVRVCRLCFEVCFPPLFVRGWLAITLFSCPFLPCFRSPFPPHPVMRFSSPSRKIVSVCLFRSFPFVFCSTQKRRRRTNPLAPVLARLYTPTTCLDIVRFF